MTLILALACSEGLVLASDGQATVATTGQQVRTAIRKLHLQWNNIAWGASGFVGLMQEAQEGFAKEYGHTNQFEKGSKEPKKKIAESIAKSLRPLLLERHVQHPGQASPATAFLFVGWPPEGPFILEVGANLLSQDHIRTGYSAIGSGDIFPYVALAGLVHFEVQKRTLREAKLIAYRIIDEAIKVAAFGLGPPIQMIEIVKPEEAGSCGKGHELDDAELKQIQEQVSAWKESEREILARLLMPAPAPSLKTE
jgi:20S proteasome alpha/beta subunit